MNDDRERSRSHLALPVLLGLMVLAQFGILNEIRYQGCVARYYDALAMSDDEPDVRRAKTEFGCNRIPLL